MLGKILARFRATPEKSVNPTPDVARALEITPERPLEYRFAPEKTDLPGTALVAALESRTLEKSRLAEDILQAVRPNTRRAYAAALRAYLAAGRDFPASPAHLADYLRNATRADGSLLDTSSLALYAAALSFAHRIAGFADPAKSIDVEMALKAIRATRGNDPERQAKPLLQDDLRRILGQMVWQGHHVPLENARDAALLLLGWTAALRRSELAALEVEHLVFSSRGLSLTLLASKNKSGTSSKAIYRGRGEVCPVRAVENWLRLAGITEGRAFRSFDMNGNLRGGITPGAIGRLIQQRAAEAGVKMREKMPSGTVLEVSGHSLRAGFITELRKRGVADWKIARMSGHKDLRMLDTYAREGRDFVDNPSDGVW